MLRAVIIALNDKDIDTFVNLLNGVRIHNPERQSKYSTLFKGTMQIPKPFSC